MVDVEHWLVALRQKRPVVGVQATCAPPQMQPALLAVVPSVSVQSGPVAQRQMFPLEHFNCELGLKLMKRDPESDLFEHPNG